MENKFKFLTKYSLSKKLKSKWFLIANIIVAIILIALTNIDTIVKLFGGDFNDELKIKIIDNTNYYDEIDANLQNVNKYIDTKVEIIKEEDLEKTKNKAKDTKDIILVINEDKENIFNVEFISDSYVDALKYQSIITCLNTAKSNIALKSSNIDPNELAKISKEVIVTRSFINEDKTKDEETSRSLLSALSLIIVLPCFMLIVFLVQMIGAEINEEKSTRGMEIIIGNVSSKVHFFSKVIASNAFILFQSFLLILYGIIGIIVRKFTSSSSASTMINDVASSLEISEVVDMLSNSGIVNKLGYIIPLIIILIVLSFLAYSLLAGIFASITTNMENFQQLQTPLMIISVIGYYLIILSAAFPGSLFIKIVSVIPLISVSLAPSLLLSGEISVSIIIIAIVLLMLLDYVLIKYGLRIYKVGILNYSEGNLWKKMFKAIKEK